MISEEIDEILARQSVELLDAMKRNEPGATEQLAQWLKQSRRHTEHYLMAVAFEQELDRVELDSQLPINERSSAPNIVALTKKHVGSAIRPPPRARWRAVSLAAGLAIVGVLYWLAHRNEFSTAVGEQRTVALEDGSVIHLNTQSRVAVRYTGKDRDIELLTGEALFKVRQDAARPFRVHTSDAVILAIGTEFNVYQRAQGTTVEVLEGRVKVVSEASHDGKGLVKPTEPPPSVSLSSGEQARIDRAGRIAMQKMSEVAALPAWRQRRLIFSGTPLPEVVAEFNRYNQSPEFVLAADENALKRVYSGVFDADDPNSLIEVLQQQPGVQVERKGDQVTIRVGAGD